MATQPNSLISVQVPKRTFIQILPADTTGLKTLYTGGSNGSKIVAIIVTSSDTAARDVQVGVTNGGTFIPLGTVTVPITAGTIAATGGVDVLAACNGLPVDNDGQAYIFLLSASDTLQVKSLTTVTTALALNFTAIGGDF